jgi:uncharacterized protein YaiL (DUF2058 family)
LIDVRYGEFEQLLAAAAALREQLEQDAVAARQEAAQAQEEARMAQVRQLITLEITY